MMYSFPTISPEGASSSIWNSAGLASTTAPNLPDIPSLASQYQNYSGFSAGAGVSDTVIAAISTEDEEDDDFENTIPQLSNLLSEAMAESQESVDNLQSVTAAAAASTNSLESSPVAPVASPVAPVASPCVADPALVPAVSPTHAPKDPGYYSESECSSNSSERDTLAGTFSKALKMDPAKSFIPLKMDTTNPFVPLSAMAAIAKPVGPLPESIPFLASSVITEFTQNPPIPSLPRFDPQSFDPQSFDQQSFDPQSFDPQDLGLSADESWKVIKKPGDHAEAVIVPDLSCAESVWGSEGGSWSGASSPLGQWGAELGKLGFGQSTRQQICVFCRNNGEDKTVYTTHTLMSKAGKVICPILYAYKCPICAATGDYAHTLKYCPMLPKGVMGTTTATTKISPAAAAMAPKLPKTATFPQHLSARAKCSMGPPHKATFPQNLQSNQRFKSTQPGGFQQGVEFQDAGYQSVGGYKGNPANYQSNQAGNYQAGNYQADTYQTGKYQGSYKKPVPDMGSIADLQEAAQKILMFTNQVMQTQQQQSAGNTGAQPSPQISQFLLRVQDNQKSGVRPDQNTQFQVPASRGGVSGNDAMVLQKLAELLSNPTAVTGQGYQPFPDFNLPKPAPAPPKEAEEVSLASLASGLPGFSTSTASFGPSFNSLPTGMPSFPAGSLPPGMPSVPTSFGPMPTAFPELPGFGKGQTSPSLNLNAASFTPTVGGGSGMKTASEDAADANSASIELFKLLGINKMAGAGGVNKNESEPSYQDKENTLASILANIQELERNH